jgi:hypothetical protein
MEAIPQKSIKDTGAESSDSMFVSSLTLEAFVIVVGFVGRITCQSRFLAIF